jgi:hypothetical protein
LIVIEAECAVVLLRIVREVQVVSG